MLILNKLQLVYKNTNQMLLGEALAAIVYLRNVWVVCNPLQMLQIDHKCMQGRNA